MVWTQAMTRWCRYLQQHNDASSMTDAGNKVTQEMLQLHWQWCFDTDTVMPKMTLSVTLWCQYQQWPHDTNIGNKAVVQTTIMWCQQWYWFCEAHTSSNAVVLSKEAEMLGMMPGCWHYHYTDAGSDAVMQTPEMLAWFLIWCWQWRCDTDSVTQISNNAMMLVMIPS